MLKYNNIANSVISVNLHNNYSIIAFAKWEFKTEKYSVSLYIKENTIDHLDLLDDYKNIIFVELGRRDNMNFRKIFLPLIMS